MTMRRTDSNMDHHTTRELVLSLTATGSGHNSHDTGHAVDSLEFGLPYKKSLYKNGKILRIASNFFPLHIFGGGGGADQSEFHYGFSLLMR